MSALPPYTWDEALSEFDLHLRATRAKNTARYYTAQLAQLVKWAKDNQIALSTFIKRDMDRFLVFREQSGRSRMTMRHDALCAKVFLAWCVKNDLLKRSNLADYRVRNAPRPPKHMPTDQEMRSLLQAARRYWEPEFHPSAKYQPPTKRAFHRERNYTILLGLVDSACRIGEMLSFKVTDWRPDEQRITVRYSKGREPRQIPVSPEWADALETWLKVRRRVMAGVEDDEGWLFVSEYGTRIDEGRLLKSLHNYTQFAGLPTEITLHSLRRYSLNRLAKNNLLAAQAIAGHKSPETTILYTKIDPEFLREAHAQTGVARGILDSKREQRRRRIL